MQIKILSAVIAGIALVSIGAPAQSETVSITVRYADLDLASAADMAALERRIEDAASQLCGLSDRDRVMVQTKARCIRDTVDSVRSKLEALRAGRTVAFSRSILVSREIR